MCQNGAVHRSDRGICGVQAGTGIPFPGGVDGLLCGSEGFYTNRFLLNTDPDRITIMGDSAGGNLAAAVCMMARDRGEFYPKNRS